MVNLRPILDRAVLLCFLLPLLLIMSIGLAFAHSWYDPWCCNDQDCKKLAPEEVTIKEDGFHYKHWVIPFDSEQVRISQDWSYHACEYPTGTIRCFYVPPGGS